MHAIALHGRNRSCGSGGCVDGLDGGGVCNVSSVKCAWCLVCIVCIVCMVLGVHERCGLCGSGGGGLSDHLIQSSTSATQGALHHLKY